MNPITIKGRINYTGKEFAIFSRNFTASLCCHVAFPYNNRKVVTIEWGPMENGIIPHSISIITSESIMPSESDFKDWLETYFKEHLATHSLIFYENN